MRRFICNTRPTGSVWSYLSCAFLFLIAAPIWSATITVDSLLDDILVATSCPASHKTLRCAIFDAVSGDTINFSVNGTIFIAGPGTQNAPLSITKTLIIDATGQSITVSGSNLQQVMNVTVAGNLTLDSITIANGNAATGGGIENLGTLTIKNSTLSRNLAGVNGGGVFNAINAMLIIINSTLSENGSNVVGGGILNDDNGTVIVTSSTISGNSASIGGGILTFGTVTITNSTLSENVAFVNGGGIYLLGGAGGGTIRLTNVTIAENFAAQAGGGIFNAGNTATLFNTIVAKSTGGDCSGAVPVTAGLDSIADDATCGGARVVSTAALNLGPLANNGGPTQTIALLPGSDAIDAGNNAFAIAAGLIFDQRGLGFTRYSNGIVDVGAFEFQACLGP